MQRESSSVIVNTIWMQPGKNCWIELLDQDQLQFFVKGQIVQVDGKQVQIKYIEDKPNGAPEKVDLNKIQEVNEELPENGFPDMVDMGIMNEGELLQNIKRRYHKDEIFTYIGPTLIVMNPYKDLSYQFTQQILQNYQSPILSGSSEYKIDEMPPHVFAISGAAYSELFTNYKNQAIVISGESGAGKTENAKYAMKFLTSLNNDPNKKNIQGDVPIEEKILSCNPILEAFGNAKTVRNDNSSRFGKYVRLLVEVRSRKIQGATITNYLLEKSRVTQQTVGERNYHIFYHLLKGADIEMLKQLGLNDGEQAMDFTKFDYLAKSECFQVNGINDVALFNEVQDSFNKINMSSIEINSIWSMVASILHLGNLTFDKSTYSDNSNCTIVEGHIIKQVCNLLQVDPDMLSNALVTKTREVGKTVIQSPLPHEQCIQARDSLTKSLYDKLFNWIVKRLNLTILPKQDINVRKTVRMSILDIQQSIQAALQDKKNVQNSKSIKRLSIGLLDIFGFENFKVNSFEQLCINFTNEKLHNLYIAYIFKSEEKELVEEGLGKYLGELNYKDNQPLIDLIAGKVGILDLLDESTQLSSSTDQALLQKIAKQFKDNANMKVPKMLKESFTIIHTAKDVEYNIIGFRNKNTDEVSKESQSAITGSKCQIIVNIFEGICGHENKNMLILDEELPKKESLKGGKADKFLGYKFRVQMNELMNELQTCDAHFIRCLKPNEQKQKDLFIQPFVLNQVRYLGLLDSIKVRKNGYCNRNLYEGFFASYAEANKKFLGVSLNKLRQQKANFKELAQQVVSDILADHIQRNEVLFGKNKIYLKQEPVNELNKLLLLVSERKKEYARKILRQYKAFLFRKKLKKAVKKLKKCFLGFRKIQAIYKMKKQRKIFLKKKKSVQKIKQIRLKLITKFHLKKYNKKIFKILIQDKKQKSTSTIFNKVLFLSLKLNLSHLKAQCQKLTEKIRREELQRLNEEERRIKEAEYQKKQKELLLQKQEEELRQKAQAELLKKQQEEQERARQEEELQKQMKNQQLLNDENDDQNQEDQQKKLIIEINNDDEINSNHQALKSNDTKKKILLQRSATQLENYENYNELLNDKPKQEEIENLDIEFTETKKGSLERTITMFAEQKVDEKDDSKLDHYTSYSFQELQQSQELDTQDKNNISQDALMDIEKCRPDLLDCIKEVNYFSFVEKIIVSRTSWGKVVPVIQLMQFNKKLDKSLTFLTKKEETIGLKIFALINEFLQEKQDSKAIQKVARIVSIGLSSSLELQDEIYLQMLKMCQDTPSILINFKMYRLIAMVSSAFPPSPRLYLAVMNFFYIKSQDPKEIKEGLKYSITLCFMRVMKTYELPEKRQFPPLIKELNYIDQMQSIKIPIAFPIGTQVIYLNVESYWTCKQAKQLLCSKLDLTIRSNYFGIYLEVFHNNNIQEKFIDDNELIMDVISKIEIERELISKQNSSLFATSTSTFNYKLSIRLRVFYKLLEKDIDTLAIYYAQHQNDFINNKLSITDEEQIINLAVSSLFVDSNPINQPFKEFTLKEVQDNIYRYIPSKFLSTQQKRNEWSNKIYLVYTNLISDKLDRIQAKFQYLDYLKSSELIMSSQFLIENYTITISNGSEQQQGDQNQGKVILAVKPLILVIVDCIKRETMKIYKFNQILRWGLSGGNSEYFVMVSEDGNTHYFNCLDAKGIYYLVKAYTNLAQGKSIS